MTVLTREIKTKSYIAKAEIQKLVVREEIQAVLMLADQLGGKVTPADIVSHLLANRPEKIGKRVIEWCASNNVLNWKGELTDIGRESLQEGKVFTSESGVYKFILTDHPLIPEKILLIEPNREGNLFKEMKELRNAENGYKIEEELITLPPEVLTLAGVEKRYNEISESKEDVRIVYIEERGVTGNPPYSPFVLSIELDRFIPPKLLIRHGKKIRQGGTPDIPYKNAMESILANKFHDWDPNTNTLKIDYNQLGPNEKRTFQKSIHFETPQLPNYGSFDPIRISFNIQPRTSQDAARWAYWLLKDRITNYIHEEEYSELCMEIANLFVEFQIRMPSQEELVDEILNETKERIRTPKYWYLRAPLDLPKELVK